MDNEQATEVQQIGAFEDGIVEKTYTKKEVKEMIASVYDAYDIEETERFRFWFESRLNDQWLNWNGWANEDKAEYYFEDDIESFIY